MTSQIISIEATTGDEKISVGTATVHIFASNEKLRRALQRLGLFWLGAVGSVFLPVVHFFLVPLFLLLGIFVFVRVMKTNGEVLDGKIACPFCGTEAVLGRAFLNWPLKEICQNCVRVLRISAKE